MASAAAVAVLGSCSQDLLNMGKEFVSGFSAFSEDRDAFVKATLNHWQKAKPDYNVCVLNNKWQHNVTISDDGIRMHVEIAANVFGTHGFNIYVFKVNILSVTCLLSNFIFLVRCNYSTWRWWLDQLGICRKFQKR